MLKQKIQEIRVVIPEKIGLIFDGKFRYRGAYGGRGSGKSIGFAKMAVISMVQDQYAMKEGNFLCCRELQKSIKDSVHSMLIDQIEEMRLSDFFECGEHFIRRTDGKGEFLFYGLKSNAKEIKSLHKVTRCWVEEAQSVSQRSLNYLLPTIREDGSEIWFTWNPDDEDDPVHNLLVTNRPENASVIKVNYYDNPFFPDVLEQERLRTLKTDKDKYDWIWNGNFNKNPEAAVYARWINEMEESGRIKAGIYDPSLPVFTAWDLGYSDQTAIIWFQTMGNEVRIIDCYENNREDVVHYMEQLYGRKIIVDAYGDNGKIYKYHLGDFIGPEGKRRESFKYEAHFAPGDAQNKLLQAGGRSFIDQAFEVGIKIRAVYAPRQQMQIDALRSTLKFTWADPDYCGELLKALRKYQFLYDEDRNKYSDVPDHDQYSHFCDAAEIVAQVWKSDIISKEKKKPRFFEDLTANEVFFPKKPNSGSYERI